jgi:hypothetical protein
MSREPVLIMSYFYPPCNLTASQRAYAWAKYLPEFGYEPIVITRNWDIPIGNQHDICLPTGQEEQVLELECGRVHYMPYIGNTRDRMMEKYGPEGKAFQRRMLTMWELVSQNVFLSSIAYRNFLDKARAILKARPEIKKMLVTANPYTQFALAYQLKKEFPRLQWFADYRDDWTTRELNKQRSLLFRLVEPLDKRSELKWTSNAAGIISVTDVLANRIKAFVKKPAYTIINGFFEEDYEGLEYPEFRNRFLINYTGYLYGDQPVEKLLDGFRRLHEKYADKIELKLRFLGTAYHPPSKDRILNRAKGLEESIEISERVPRDLSMKLEAESDVFVMLPYEGHKGIPGSKLYQYLGHDKPILVYPSDHDIIEETVTKAGTGVVCETEDEFVERVSKLIEAKIKDGKLPKMQSDPSPFSRRGSTKELAALLSKN